jgi:adenine-specific DNA-methyltransferase
METLSQPRFTKRYHTVTEEKFGGATYTPKILADFVAQKIVKTVQKLSAARPLRVLDPGVGHGELLVSLLEHLADQPDLNIEVYGFETDRKALDTATARLRRQFPRISLHFETYNFLGFVLEHFGAGGYGGLFRSAVPEAYDLIIANPPYVRTQIMGTAQAQLLAEQFGLAGRVDLYYAFVLAMSQVLKPNGIAGIIVSNRFMTTRSGACVRKALLERFNVRHAWDLGDTKLFDAAVLPAVLLVEGRNGHKPEAPAFTSIYQTAEPACQRSTNPISAVAGEGVVEIDDGRHFQVRHGKLDTSGTPDGIWRVATKAVDDWLATVAAHSWGTFRDIGRIRVGVKTCADKIFIRNDWQDMPEADRPELLKPLITHHIARRFKPLMSQRPTQILYPHEVLQGRRRAVDLGKYPLSNAYLESHRAVLEGREYVIEAGREWYEIWVPQDPAAWNQPKLVFRDIAEEPTFWIDQDGSVVNGDCYWLVCQNPAQTDLLWLAAAVGNSTFIEQFYDYCFHNKLYAGRRRFITQYVEKFPLPDPHSSLGKIIIAKSKQVYECLLSSQAEQLQKELEAMVWKALCGAETASCI